MHQSLPQTLFLCICVLFLSLSCAGTTAAAPKEKILKKTTYTDKNGEHLVTLTSTGLYQSRASSLPDDILANADISAYDRLIDASSDQPASKTLLWQMHDFVHECEASATAEFAEVSPQITDLDGNGVSEVWLVYYVGCRGDVSPEGMKILMYEGSRKYALRGETFVHVDGMDLGGSYKADPSFRTAPPVFLRFADELWQKNRQH